MIILTIRTDKPEAEVGLYQNSDRLDYEIWSAHMELSETIHRRIVNILQAQHLDMKNLEGVIVYAGPGSFTGLRIGISAANAFAFSLKIPVIGASGDNWITDGSRILLSSNKSLNRSVVPKYGRPAHTTEPKK